MTKRLGVLSGVIGLLLLTLAPGHVASAAPERRFAYLATADSATWTNIFELTPTPAGEPAPFGSFLVTSVGDRITIHLDDVGTADGLAIPVRMADGRGSVFEGCVPVRTTVQIRGLLPERPLGVWIGEFALDELVVKQTVALDCSALGTGGVATLIGVK